ncbi:MAG: tRNA (adenosine(37)-N6)-threonylcarbamoyltransferase complex dimerization subunit type 1 TsaB [Halothiobacillaceae bacterium]|nr:MAG: tRNA (adenosine(37)-N6)-threonylcarbamoyltransferase complex dimerization subunit type 1 TsaB [Halothiobacillaceae bacterium]
MKLLAIDTSTEACSAALLIDGKVLEEYALAPRRHTELILPMVGRLLAATALRLEQLDGIAFARGPGAFTGLRIAAGVTQGLAFGAGLPVVPVSSLAALAHAAWRLHGAEHVLTALDARMHEVYWGGWRVRGLGDVQAVDAERVVAPADVPCPEGGRWFAAGPGWAAYDEALRSRCGAVESGRDPNLLPRAHDVALIGGQLAAHGGLLPAEQAQPVYLRDRVAEKPRPR